MKKSLIFFTLLSFSFIYIGCKKKDEPDTSKAYIKYYGGIDVDKASDLQVTPDGGFILIGSTSSEGAGSFDILVVKADKEGNEEWHKTYGGPLADEGGGIRMIPDGSGYILVGTIQKKAIAPATDSTSDMYAVRINSTGDVLWTKQYSYSSASVVTGERGTGVEITNSGGFIMLGIVDSATSTTPSYNVFAVETDNTGKRTSLSDFTYGASNSIGNTTTNVNISFEGNYLFTTSTQQKASATVYLPTPRPIKARTFGLNTPFTIIAAPTNNFGWDLNLYDTKEIAKANSNYLMIGSYGNPTITDMYVMKLNTSLNKVGEVIKIGSSDGVENGASVQQTSDGGIIALGTTTSASIIGNSDHQADIYVVKLGADGQKQWEKTFGYKGNDKALKIRTTNDGGYMILGTIDFGNNVDNSPEPKSNVVAVIKINGNGEINNIP